MTEGVIVDINEGLAHVRLNRPEKRNALDAEMFDGAKASPWRSVPNSATTSLLTHSNMRTSSRGAAQTPFVPPSRERP